MPTCLKKIAIQAKIALYFQHPAEKQHNFINTKSFDTTSWIRGPLKGHALKNLIKSNSITKQNLVSWKAALLCV